MRGILIAFVAVWGGLMPVSCSRQASQPPPDLTLPRAQIAEPKRVNAPHLPNAYQIHDKVISGGQPDGEEAFREMVALGIRTVISVDGARPDVETARRYGLRYVHMPHGYDGISDARVKELAKAVRELDGPIYIHCHHGKHRSPAAAAAACVTAGYLPSESAVRVLKVAGTSEQYRGLYQAVENARPADEAALDALKVQYHEQADLPRVAEVMVAIEHIFDRLRNIQEAGWHPPAKHPDLDPPHEALMLREQFAEMLRIPEVTRANERFILMTRNSEAAARSLEDALRSWKPAGRQDPPPQNLSVRFGELKALCSSCHKEFRDVPLSEKNRP